MAFTSRDVMFVLRTQDYASRELNKLGRTFGRLNRAMEASDKQMRQGIGEATAKYEKSTQRLDKAQQQVANTLTNRTAKANATLQRGLLQNKSAYDQQTTAIKKAQAAWKGDLQEKVTRAKKAETAATNVLNTKYKTLADRSTRLANAYMNVRNQRIDESHQRTSKAVGTLNNQQAQYNATLTDRNRRMAVANNLMERELKTNKSLTDRQRQRYSQAIDQNKSYIQMNRLAMDSYKARTKAEIDGHNAAHKAFSERATKENQRRQEQLKTRLDNLKVQRQAEVAAVQRTTAAQVDAARKEAALAQEKLTRAQQVADRDYRATNEGLKRIFANRVAHAEKQAAMGRAQVAKLRAQRQAEFEIEKAHVRALAENQQRAIMQQQARMQRMMSAGAGLSMGGALLMGTGLGVVKKLKDMTTEAASFRQEIALAATQIDGIAVGVGSLSAHVLDVAREVPAPIETMAGTLYDIFSSMDVNVGQAKELLRGFAREAVGGNASVRDSARSTIAILNGMNLTVEDLTRVQDFQFQTVRKGVITYEQLSKNIGKLIPALARSGQEIETGGAMLAFLTRNGLSAEMATTAAARALELLYDPRVVKRMEEQGIVVRDNAGHYLDLEKVLGQLAHRIGDMPAFERGSAMQELFGGAGYRIQARRFFDVVIPNFEEFRKHVKWQQNAGGALNDAYDQMFRQPQTQIELLKNNVAALRKEMGGKLFAVLNKIVDGVRGVVDWFNSLDEGLKENIVRFAAFAAGTAVVVGAILTLVGMFMLLTSLLAPLVGGIGAAAAAIAGVAFVLPVLIGALAVLGFNLESIRASWDSFKQAMGTVPGLITLAITAIYLLIAANLQLSTSNITMAGSFAAVKGGLTGIVGAAKAASAALWAVIATNPLLLALAVAITTISAAWYILGKRNRELNASIKTHTEALIEQIDVIGESVESFHSYQSVITNTIKKTSEQVLKEKELWQAIVDNNNLRTGDVLSGIVNENSMRGKTREAIQAEVDALGSNLSALERRRAFGVLNRSEDQKRYFAMVDLLKVYDQESEASEIAQRNMRDEMRDRGGLSEAMANYMALAGQNNHQALEYRHTLKTQIVELLQMKGAYEDLDPELRAMIGNEEEFADILAEVNSDLDDQAHALGELQARAEAIIGTLASLSSVTDAWSAATEKANEANNALEEPLENVTITLGDWMGAMREARNTSEQMFGDMRTIIENNSSSISEDAGLAMGAILAMGDAGPEAMSLLASADPKEFKEIMRHIRLEAALTGDEVIKHMDDMFTGMDRLTQDYGDLSNKQFNRIFEAVAITADTYGDQVKGYTDDMMVGIAEMIQKGKKPTVNEMIAIGASLAEAAGNGGQDSVDALLHHLATGTGSISEILTRWGQATANGLNPTLRALGKPPISFSAIHGRSAKYTGGGPTGDGYGIEQYNLGGQIRGRGPDRDSIVAAMTPGEFVIRRKAVDRLDLQSLHELNRTGNPYSLMPRYNKGGFVSGKDVPAVPSMNPYQFPITRPPREAVRYTRKHVADWVNENAAPELGGGVGWRKMWAAVSRRFPTVNLHSAYRPGAITATGNPSYHGQGRAIDISPRMDIFNWLAQNYRNSREIIFSPANMRQIHNGRNHMYTGITRNMHWDHIHWAMKNGGIINEPVIGQGQHTGAMYSFGEGGHPEQVTPVGATGNIEDKLDALINLLAEREPLQVNVSTKDDPDDFARRSATALKARM